MFFLGNSPVEVKSRRLELHQAAVTLRRCARAEVTRGLVPDLPKTSVLPLRPRLPQWESKRRLSRKALRWGERRRNNKIRCREGTAPGE